MRKKTKTGLWITGGVVVVVGGAALAFGPSVYADYANGVAAAAPTLAPASPAAAGTVPAVDADELSGSWSVGKDSFAGYRVDEVLRDQDITVTGRTDDVTGELTVEKIGRAHV